MSAPMSPDAVSLERKYADKVDGPNVGIVEVEFVTKARPQDDEGQSGRCDLIAGNTQGKAWAPTAIEVPGTPIMASAIDGILGT